MAEVSLNSRMEFYVNHWDTQAVHFFIEGSLWSSSNSCSLGNTLSSISDGTALLLFTMMEIANNDFPLFLSENFPAICYSIVLISFILFSIVARKPCMTGSIRIFEKLNFTPKLSVLVSLKVKLPNMTD